MSDTTPVKKQRKKRSKVAKSRLHIYIPNDYIADIDKKAQDVKVSRSVMVQMLIGHGLKHFKLRG